MWNPAAIAGEVGGAREVLPQARLDQAQRLLITLYALLGLYAGLNLYTRMVRFKTQYSAFAGEPPRRGRLIEHRLQVLRSLSRFSFVALVHVVSISR